MCRQGTKYLVNIFYVTSLYCRWSSAVHGCQPTVTELFRSPQLATTMVYSSTSRLHHHCLSSPVVSRRTCLDAAFNGYIPLLLCRTPSLRNTLLALVRKWVKVKLFLHHWGVVQWARVVKLSSQLSSRGKTRVQMSVVGSFLVSKWL